LDWVVVFAAGEQVVFAPGFDDFAALGVGFIWQVALDDAPSLAVVVGFVVIGVFAAVWSAAVDIVEDFVGEGGRDISPCCWGRPRFDGLHLIAAGIELGWVIEFDADEVEPLCVGGSLCDVDLCAVDADVIAAVLLWDAESFGLIFAHWHTGMVKAAGVDVRACAASGVGVTWFHLSFANVMWGVDGDVELGCEVGEL